VSATTTWSRDESENPPGRSGVFSDGRSAPRAPKAVEPDSYSRDHGDDLVPGEQERCCLTAGAAAPAASTIRATREEPVANSGPGSSLLVGASLGPVEVAIRAAG
jgi:hypothetical protein